ncbi:TIGR00255 family protein [Ekhidna lutea]|uniref:TIGR00255 family protein n=1 Tax=Ekhidna lutea TaxID=447679 RepID=A0A239IQW9_EKHLU|nr:YicC/YloC family endoribonuclease [Ekhidna lutea]SNS95957.1 TIGR00255 family protein [Ekhidna lutea]
MQQSMTGYGREERTSKNLLIKTEIKALNSKFLDFSPRLPKELSAREADIRNLITDQLKRGKVMLNIDLELADETSLNVHVDEVRFKAYFEKFSSLTEAVNSHSSDLVKLALQAPDVIKQEEIDPEALPWNEIKGCLQSAIDQCIVFRKQEGETLEKKLSDYIKNIRDGLKSVEENDASRTENIRTRLQKNLDEIKERVQVDQNRFEQELIFYMERLDISEEKVRLKQHLDYFDEVLTKEDCAGKKLGFIAQEIGREINTIGSKANHAEIQRTVVMMKDELEKIKEQNLNIV